MNQYNKEERKLLLQLAHDAINYGLEHHAIMPVNLQQYTSKLQMHRACFVTLKINGQLRGCIGSLEAHQPLIIDLAHNAYAAAFGDPRFPPLTKDEFTQLELHISILSKSTPMQFTSEHDLIKQLRPGIDGLILTAEGLRGTFLPSVWQELPTPEQFLSHLKLKAGLPRDYWSENIKIERYSVEAIDPL